MNSVLSPDGTEHLVTDDVSGRVVAVPVVLTNHMNPVAELRLFLTRCLFHPERVAGVRVVTESPHGMTPMEMRGALATHHWHASAPGNEPTPEELAAHHARIADAKAGRYVRPNPDHGHDAGA